MRLNPRNASTDTVASWSLRSLSPYWTGPAIGMVPYAATSDSELAVVSLSSGTIDGTSASLDGDHMSVNSSRMKLAKISPGTVCTSGRQRNTTARETSATIMIFRRSNRSTSTPMNGARNSPGATRAVVTSAMAASGCVEMLAARDVMAKKPTQSPRAEITWTLKSAKNRCEPNTRPTQPTGSAGSAPGAASLTWVRGLLLGR